MGRRNVRLEELRRLESKTQDAQFVREVREGLGCSRFEAEAVLDVVREVYAMGGEASSAVQSPGRVTLMAVDADEPAGKPVVECQKRTVCLTVHRGAEDDRLLRDGGARAFRRARIADLCQEALSQGALLTREDLAYRVFFVSPSTITRDLRALREQAPSSVVPLRSTIQDIGPVLTHRVEIVRLALEGKTTSQICAIVRHSPSAVANYVSTFTRVAQLVARDLEVGQIAFLLRRGRSLIEQYVRLVEGCASDRNQRYHLEELLRIGGGEKGARGGRGDGASA